MKKRYTYICCVLPAALMLNNIPMFLSGVWQLIAACVLALAVWVLVWLRLYSTQALRPEFAILTIVPQMLGYIGLYAGSESMKTFMTPEWQNMYAILWLGTAFVGIRSMKAGSYEATQQGKKDSVFIMMSILVVAFCFAACAGWNMKLFLPLINLS